MAPPLVSVIIPAYNQAAYLSTAIESVLTQTYENLELYVVDDASPDETAAIVASYQDKRVHYLAHEENQGLPTARNSGLLACGGEILALLDADDYFHPEKLAEHVTFLQARPDVEVTYNGRFDLHHSENSVRSLWMPPADVTLHECIMGFPFSPSDMVFRRSVIEHSGLFNSNLTSGGEDLDYPCRLALNGHRFGRVARFLNFRRYHSSRKKKNLRGRLDDYFHALNAVFEDPACPENLNQYRNEAFANCYLEVSWYALLQDDPALSQECINQIMTLYPQMFDGEPSRYLYFLIDQAIADRSRDHLKLLDAAIAILPKSAGTFLSRKDWMVKTSCLRKGLLSVMFEGLERGKAYLGEMTLSNYQLDAVETEWLTHNLMNIFNALGAQEANRALQDVIQCLCAFGYEPQANLLTSRVNFNVALIADKAGNHRQALHTIIRSVQAKPATLRNRGTLAILYRSLVKSVVGNMTMKGTF